MISNRTRICIKIIDNVSKFEFTLEEPDEECINCILDNILSIPEGELRDISIGLYKDGLMKLECRRTKKSYMITQNFFKKYFPDL